MTVAFVSPWVDQLRNSHDFLGDFVAETLLYEESGALVSFLLAKSCSYLEKKELPLQAMLNLYKDLDEIGVVEEKDVTVQPFDVGRLSLNCGFSERLCFLQERN